MIRRKDKSVTWTVKNTKIYFLRHLVSSTSLTAVNVKKVWVRLTKKFNLKTSSKKKMDGPIWGGLRENITIYTSPPKVETFSSSLGCSKNYTI